MERHNSLKLSAQDQDPIFRAPSVSILSVKLDWLHTVDLGVAAYLHWVFAIQHHGGAAWQKQILGELAFVFLLVRGLDSPWHTLFQFGWTHVEMP
jgi:hypothetical protein